MQKTLAIDFSLYLDEDQMDVLCLRRSTVEYKLQVATSSYCYHVVIL